ncbi:MAG: hypothetical protein L0154_29310 [Chloroflexi bacterium]|nr:hypothetical protein [Chloroflexota bacterium]
MMTVDYTPMVVMFLMMVVGLGVVIALGFFALNLPNEVAKRKHHEHFGDEVAEKAKRGRLMLSDDGELVEVADYEAQVDEQRKRSY